MDLNHRKPSSVERMRSSAPSIGVPRSKDMPTIENAIPMRVLKHDINMYVESVQLV